MEKIYLDTSVVSAHFDDRIPYQRDLTREWWPKAKLIYEIWLSMVTLTELMESDEPKRSEFSKFVQDIPILELAPQVEDLTEKYIGAKIVPVKYLADGYHLAYASHYKIDYFVTWNCSHFANVNTRRKFRLFNDANGLFTPEIVTPEFFMEVEE